MSRTPFADGAFEAGGAYRTTGLLNKMGLLKNKNRGLHQFVRIPVGIERALYLASKDPAFRKQLLEDRSGALEEAVLRFSRPFGRGKRRSC